MSSQDVWPVVILLEKVTIFQIFKKAGQNCCPRREKRTDRPSGNRSIVQCKTAQGCRFDQNLAERNGKPWCAWSPFRDFRERFWLKVTLRDELTCCTRQDLASRPTWDPRWWPLCRCNAQGSTKEKDYPISEISRKQKGIIWYCAFIKNIE